MQHMFFDMMLPHGFLDEDTRINCLQRGCSVADAIGIDIVEIGRIARAFSNYSNRFVRRILGPDEVLIFERRADGIQFLAGRFAAKEAVVKALSRYLSRRPPLASLQILNDDAGNPTLVLPAQLQERLAGIRCLVSISHSHSDAVAVAVLSDE